jgi:hypothetical protein
LKLYFRFYGGKYRAAPRYPTPVYKTIIEPFAGSAGYSVRYYTHDVILVEKDPVLVGMWRYLQQASAADFRGLPDLLLGQTVDDLSVCQEAKWLIGFWLNAATSRPRKSPSAWMRQGHRPNSFWGPAVRERLAADAGKVKHWRIIEGDYTKAPVVEATWFIDPPYIDAGTYYHFSDIDYAKLARWVKGRKGQVMVCEQQGATWLPFKPFHVCKSNPSYGNGKSAEVLYQENQ